MRHDDGLENQDRGAEVRPPDRALARAARALRLELLARQGPAHLLRREHARRRAARARRRHSAPRAGRHLRSRHRRAQHHRGAAARASSSKARRSCSRRSAGSTSASAACRSACRPASRSAAPKSLQGKRIATTYPRILRDYLQQERRRGADRRVLRRRRDRAEPRQGRSHLRSRLERLDAARAPALRSRDDPREPRGADPDAEEADAARRPSGCSGCCCAFRACCRSRRASTSCCTRRARR